MKLALLSYYTRDHEDYQVVADINVPARDQYCKRHGYDHIVHCGPYHDPSLYYAVARIFKVYDMFFKSESPPDLIWVLNIQAVLTNQTIPVTQYLDDNYDFFITKDCHVVNAGSFIIRRGEWSKKWLEMIMDRAPKVGGPWHENRVVIDEWEKPEWKDHIKILPQNLINAYNYELYAPNWGKTTPGHWQKGDLVLSLPGINMAKRLQLIKEFQSKIIT